MRAEDPPQRGQVEARVAGGIRVETEGLARGLPARLDRPDQHRGREGGDRSLHPERPQEQRVRHEQDHDGGEAHRERDADASDQEAGGQQRADRRADQVRSVEARDLASQLAGFGVGAGDRHRQQRPKTQRGGQHQCRSHGQLRDDERGRAWRKRAVELEECERQHLRDDQAQEGPGGGAGEQPGARVRRHGRDLPPQRTRGQSRARGEAGQVRGEHDRHAVGGGAEHERQRARPGDLVHHRRRARDRERNDQRRGGPRCRRREPGLDRSDRRRRRRGGETRAEAPAQRQHCDTHRDIGESGGVQRAGEPEDREQQEDREQGPGDRARGIDRVQASDEAARRARLRGHRPGQNRKRGAHRRRGGKQRDQAGREPCRRGPLGQRAQQRGSDEAEQARPRFEQAVDEQRIAPRPQQPRGDGAAERHAAHERSQHRGDRQRRGPELEQQQPGPDDLEDESRSPAHAEGAQQEAPGRGGRTHPWRWALETGSSGERGGAESPGNSKKKVVPPPEAGS